MMPTAPIEAAARHIVIVMHDFSTGGSERIAIRLANQWARCGRLVTILCGTIEGPARTLVAPNVTIRGIWPEICRSPLSRFTLAGALAREVAQLMPDLIFVPGNFHIPVAGVLGRVLGADRPALVCKLSNPLYRRDRSRFAQALFGYVTRWCARPVDIFVAMSATLQEEAITVLRRPEIRMIHEPNVDNPERARPSTVHHSDDAPLIVCAGRLTEQKNFALAIRAFAKLNPSRNARLLILGEGDEHKTLEMEVKRHGLVDRVVFGGHVADIRPALAKAQLFLLSSCYEGYPAVLIEALAAGVPIVATNCSPAMREIMVDPSFGRVVPQDAAALAEAMEDVLGGPLPSPEPLFALLDRHRLDYSAQRYLDLFDWTVASRRIDHVLRMSTTCRA